MLTSAQFFLGAISLGMALFRGNEQALVFHQEEIMGHANAAASRMAQAHAWAANAIANNNAISVALLSPRFTVESDTLAMHENGAFACGSGNPFLQKVCAQYGRGIPRITAKLGWIRTQQTGMWRSLSTLSSRLDAVVSAHAEAEARAELAAAAPDAELVVSDPARQRSPWGRPNGGRACELALEDSLASGTLGHAFPLLMINVLGLSVPAIAGQLQGFVCSAAAGGVQPRLTSLPSIAKKARRTCRELEARLREAVQEASYGELREGIEPHIPEDAKPYVECERGTRRRGRSAALGACTFQRDKCVEDNTLTASADLAKSFGLLGGDASGTPLAPSDENWNSGPSFRVCVEVSRPVDREATRLSRAIKTLVSFGTDTQGDDLVVSSAAACGRWYFPDGEGSRFASVEKSRQPFVAAWTHALAGAPTGGGR